MKVVIIEDEPLVARDIEKLVTSLEPTCEIQTILTSVESSIKWFGTNEIPDLILSDIQLSDGTSFEIFEARPLSCPIIFTTAYDDYAIRAFKLNSIDYLLKPVDATELSAALRKYKNLTTSQSAEQQLRSLIVQLGSKSKVYKDRFLVVQGNAFVPVLRDDIGYFHKDQLIFLYNMHNERFVCEIHALDELEALLDPAIFFRVNRQFVLHIRAVSKVKSTHKGLSVVLKQPLNIEIDISREKATAFKKWLG